MSDDDDSSGCISVVFTGNARQDGVIGRNFGSISQTHIHQTVKSRDAVATAATAATSGGGDNGSVAVASSASATTSIGSVRGNVNAGAGDQHNYGASAHSTVTSQQRVDEHAARIDAQHREQCVLVRDQLRAVMAAVTRIACASPHNAPSAFVASLIDAEVWKDTDDMRMRKSPTADIADVKRLHETQQLMHTNFCVMMRDLYALERLVGMVAPKVAAQQ